MISYAQNFEDVILHRAFSDRKDGFFVDVGAAHPVDDSVTCHFYERGWCGINVEPDARLFAQLAQTRTRDINLECVIGDPASLGSATTLSIVSNPGLSTLSTESASEYERQGMQVSQTTVPVMRLADVLAKYTLGRDIHFMKVDVEGSEIEVLDSNDWQLFRPWIVVVEVVVSNTQAGKPTSQPSGRMRASEIDQAMTSYGYTACYFDGLNTFFVAEEHGGLASRISTPPNVFDDFIRAREARCAEERAAFQAQAEDVELRLISFSKDADAEIKRLEAVAEAARKSAHDTGAWAASLEGQIESITKSWQWKLTHPLAGRRSH
jgi:FkbM family methyltransferase